MKPIASAETAREAEVKSEVMKVTLGQEVEIDWSLERLINRNSELFDL